MNSICDLERTFNLEEIVNLLVGNVIPTGDHSYDTDIVSGNADVLCELTFTLVSQLSCMSSYSNRNEESVMKIGKKARNALIEIKDLVDVEVEDE